MSSNETVDLALRYGNFNRYYEFNTVESRLNFVEKIFKEDIFHLNLHDDYISILDIGCNEGDLGIAICKKIRDKEPKTKLYYIGIDIDENLISSAKNKWDNLNSEDFKIEFFAKDVMSADFFDYVENYFQQNRIRRGEFDFIFCFSVLMWIHLNHGDLGFNDFLRFMSDYSRYILIEPQPYRKYLDANRRMFDAGKDEFDMRAIRIKNIDTHITEYLINDCTMKYVLNLGTTKWFRNIYFFYR